MTSTVDMFVEMALLTALIREWYIWGLDVELSHEYSLAENYLFPPIHLSSEDALG